MKRLLFVLATLGWMAASSLSYAHVNPPLVLMSDREAMAAALPGAADFQPSPLKLSGAQKKMLQQQWRWKVDERSLRLHDGRDGQGRAMGSVVFLTQPTLHSPVRVAVGIDKVGRIAGLAVVEVSEESYSWVKPLLDRGLTRAYVGANARSEFKLPPDTATGRQRTMEQFYAKVIAVLAQRAAALFDSSVRTAGN